MERAPRAREAKPRIRQGTVLEIGAFELHRNYGTATVTGVNNMLGWALTFLVVALIAAALGFGGIAGASAGIAQILFVVFLILFVVAMVARAVQGKPPV